MFTGLVAGVGLVTAIARRASGTTIDVALGGLTAGSSIGDSIALSGVCCTLTALDGEVGRFVLSPETLQCTRLGELTQGERLNLEPPLRLTDQLGGHMVSGHVDAVGEVIGAIDPKAGGELRVRLPAGLGRYCVHKGSITLDGVSLTIARLEPGEVVMAAIIPHTASSTTLGLVAIGSRVNVEVDLIAKYIEKLAGAYLPPTTGG